MAGIASMMMQTMSVKRTAIKVLAHHSGRTIDEGSWRRNCLDLFKVMRAAQNLYLVLEQTNEAMLRVAVEVITDMKARKMLWWNDSWYSDEEKREHFKAIVAEKLDKVLGWLNGEDRSSGDIGETMSATELANLKARLAEAEHSREAAEKQQHMAEMVCRDMENRLKDAQDKISALEKANTGGSRRAAGSMATGPMEAAELQKKLGASDARIQELEKNLNAAMRELHESREAARRGKELGPLEKDLAQAKKRIADQDALLEKLKSQTSKKEDTPTQKSSGASTAGGPRETTANSKELTDRMATMKAQHVEEMEAQRVRLQAEIDKYKAQLAAMGKGGQEEGHQPPAAGEEAPRPRFAGDKQTAKGMEAVKAELANALKELDISAAKLAKKDQQLAALREENTELQDQKSRMLRTLNQLREQLRKVSDIAKRKGCSETVQELMDEAGLTVTLNSSEMRCFQRLYEDALRRMEKTKRLEQMLHVNQAAAAEANAKTASLQQLTYQQSPPQPTATFSQMVWPDPQGATAAEPPLAVLEGSETPVQPWSMPPTPSLSQRQPSPRTPKTRRTSFPTLHGEGLPPPAGVFGRTWKEGTTTERLPVGIPSAASLDCAPTSVQANRVMPFSEVPPGSAGNLQAEVLVGLPLQKRMEKRLEATHSGLLPEVPIWSNEPEPQPPYVQAPVKASEPRKAHPPALRLPLSSSPALSPAPSPLASTGLQAIVQGTHLGERPATSPLAEASLTLPAAEVHSPMSAASNDLGLAGRRRPRGSVYRNPMLQLDAQAASPSTSPLVCRSLCEASMDSLGPRPESSSSGSMPSRALRATHKSASDVSLPRPGIDVNIHIETLAGSGKLARLMSSGEPGGDLGLHVDGFGGAGKLGNLILGSEASTSDETGAGKVTRSCKGRLKGWKIAPLQALSSSQPQLPHAVGRLHSVPAHEPRAVSRGRKESASVTLPPACGLSLLTIEGMSAEVPSGKELLDVA